MKIGSALIKLLVASIFFLHCSATHSAADNNHSLSSGGKLFSVSLEEADVSGARFSDAFLVLYENGKVLDKLKVSGEGFVLEVARDFFGKRDDGIVIVIESGGSGGFIDWSLLRIANGRIKKVFSWTGIFQGQIKISGATVEEWQSMRCTRYFWSSGKIVKLAGAAKTAQDAGARLVSYSIGAGNKISIQGLDSPPVKARNEEGFVAGLKMKAGKKLKLIRTGGGKPDRILYDPGVPPVIETGKEPNAWVAANPGESWIVIIPGGYDWEDSLKIMIRVE
jgi:hypothetical protein